MSRARSILVGLIVMLATLVGWEVGAVVQRAHHHHTPSTPSDTVVP